ncbi:MAG: glutathione S-transferase [Rhodocyclaceae bacterium]|nr:glutathione S-transferase [Rhodocyclaceae bacterium]
MRPWVLMRQTGIPFHEHMIRFDSFEADSQFKRTASALSPTGKVPVLTDGHLGGLVIWDTLAICEYLAERHPDKHLWPADVATRARARSICAEMHSGFGAMRQHFIMNIEASLPDVGRLVLRDQPAVRADVERIIEMWSGLLRRSGGPMLFGEFSIADAFYAPVCMRFTTYHVPLPDDVATYVKRVRELPGVADWIRDARAENDFLPFEEPYRLHR